MSNLLLKVQTIFNENDEGTVKAVLFRVDLPASDATQFPLGSHWTADITQYQPTENAIQTGVPDDAGS